MDLCDGMNWNEQHSKLERLYGDPEGGRAALDV